MNTITRSKYCVSYTSFSLQVLLLFSLSFSIIISMTHSWNKVILMRYPLMQRITTRRTRNDIYGRNIFQHDNMFFISSTISKRFKTTSSLSSTYHSSESISDVTARSSLINATIPSIKDGSLHGIIFDMDGTLIQHCIDFADMRKRIYEIADNDSFTSKMSSTSSSSNTNKRGDVLELYKTFSPEGQIKAKQVFKDIEQKAMNDMKLMNGIGDLCHYLDSVNIQRAVLTRNVNPSVELLHHKLSNESGVTQSFYPIVTRETVANDDEPNGPFIRPKPHPDAIFHICKLWNCHPKNVLMVGDSVADDIVAAYRAGCGGSILLQMDGLSFDNDSGGGGTAPGHSLDELATIERTPSLTVTSLQHLKEILEGSRVD